MASAVSVHHDPEVRNPELCPHCSGGFVFEPTEDTLVDEVDEAERKGLSPTALIRDLYKKSA